MRSGALATPETFAAKCPWCRRAPLVGHHCSHCNNELQCTGFGDVDDGGPPKCCRDSRGEYRQCVRHIEEERQTEAYNRAHSAARLSGDAL